MRDSQRWDIEGIGGQSSRTGFVGGCLFLFGLIVFLFATGTVILVSRDLRGSLAAIVTMLGILLVFAAAGIGLMVMAWKGRRSGREARLREARHPGQPWLWREDWEQGFARPDRRSDARFRMAAMPGVLGGRLLGQVETVGHKPASGRLEIVLSCVSWKAGPPHGGRSEILWQEKSTAALVPNASGALADVDIELPFDVRATGGYGPGQRERILWRLTVRATESEFHASFTVPVFQTAESDPGRTRERLEAQAGSRLAAESPAPRRVERASTPEGIGYRMPSTPNRSMATMATIFGLVFLAGAVLLLSQLGGPLESTMGVFGVLLAGGIGLALLLAGVWLWFGEITVVTLPHGLRIRSSCLGLARTRMIRADEIRGFDIQPAMQKGAEVWYQVELQIVGGGTAICGSGMEKSEAEWLVGEIRKDLKIT